MHADGDRQVVERVLSSEMVTVGEYLQICKLKLSTTKMVSEAFLLNSKEAECELEVNLNNKTLSFVPSPNTLNEGCPTCDPRCNKFVSSL